MRAGLSLHGLRAGRNASQMTSLTLQQIGLYGVAMAVLFAVPGPVWLMLVSRCLHHGLIAGIAVAIGVGLGDLIWPALALFSLTTLASIHLDVLVWLRYLTVGMFVGLGVMMLISRPAPLGTASMSKPAGSGTERWLMGIIAGLAVVIGNPKAILFYLGILPGFFEIDSLLLADIVIISVISACVPFFGNICLALLVKQVASLISSAAAMRLVHRITGWVMIAVGLVIFVTL